MCAQVCTQGAGTPGFKGVHTGVHRGRCLRKREAQEGAFDLQTLSAASLRPWTGRGAVSKERSRTARGAEEAAQGARAQSSGAWGPGLRSALSAASGLHLTQGGPHAPGHLSLCAHGDHSGWPFLNAHIVEMPQQAGGNSS